MAYEESLYIVCSYGVYDVYADEDGFLKSYPIAPEYYCDPQEGNFQYPDRGVHISMHFGWDTTEGDYPCRWHVRCTGVSGGGTSGVRSEFLDQPSNVVVINTRPSNHESNGFFVLTVVAEFPNGTRLQREFTFKVADIPRSDELNRVRAAYAEIDEIDHELRELRQKIKHLEEERREWKHAAGSTTDARLPN